MPHESRSTPEPLDARSALPENPYLSPEGAWGDKAFSGVRDRLDAAIQEVQANLASAWDDAATLGYELGFQAGTRETAEELRAFYERALTDQEAASARALQEQTEQLLAAHREALNSYQEQSRLEIERMALEHEAQLGAWKDTVRRQTEQELQARFSEELHAAAEQGRQDTERAVRAALAAPEGATSDDLIREARAEGYTQGLNESARRYEEVMSRAILERREAVEAAYQRGLDEAAGQMEKELQAAHQEGYRQGLAEAAKAAMPLSGAVLPPLLDEARRQAYENGYEDGRGVGFSRGRRQAETELAAKLHEASRSAYHEGFLDGKRTVADAERSWAFGVLHLPPDASSGEIKQHYKRLSMALHPDQNPQLADVFIKNLNRARQLLDS